MSAASGIAAPAIYVIDESGINALAAGLDINDAVILVTSGALKHLSRDEMRGVIAHEFSHIFNGDMSLNLRLTSMIYGILSVGILGRFIIRIAAENRNKGAVVLLPFGVLFVALGAVGTFLGSAIKVMVSRSREYLVDASAIKATENSTGITSALKKILLLAEGSMIANPRAAEFSHMFFADYSGSRIRSFFKMKTHPPLKIRILVIDPDYSAESQGQKVGGVVINHDKKIEAALLPVIAADDIENINQELIDEVCDVIAEIPANIKNFTANALGAEAVIYSLLVELDGDFRQKRLQLLEDNSGEYFNELTKELHTKIGELDKKFRLPLIELSIASLRNLTATQYKKFKSNVNLLVKADSKVSLFEWSLSKILFMRSLFFLYEVWPAEITTISNGFDKSLKLFFTFAFISSQNVT